MQKKQSGESAQFPRPIPAAVHQNPETSKVISRIQNLRPGFFCLEHKTYDLQVFIVFNHLFESPFVAKGASCSLIFALSPTTTIVICSGLTYCAVIF